MRNKYLTIIALTGIIGIQSCQKEHDDPPPANGPVPLQYLVKSIEWDNGTVANVQYNADSTIREIAYSNPSATGLLSFDWQGKKLTAQSYDESYYKTTYQYQQDKLVSMTIINKWSPALTTRLEYAYDARGRLGELKYFKTNEAGTQLVTVSRYDYNGNGELTAISTTQPSNKVVLKHTIDAWSPECEINAWLFASPTLTEYYTLYNYPLLSTLHKLPARVTKTILEPGKAAKEEKIESIAYSISNKRIDQTVTTLEFPEYPHLNQTQTTVYKY